MAGNSGMLGDGVDELPCCWVELGVGEGVDAGGCVGSERLGGVGVDTVT